MRYACAVHNESPCVTKGKYLNSAWLGSLVVENCLLKKEESFTTMITRFIRAGRGMFSLAVGMKVDDLPGKMCKTDFQPTVMVSSVLIDTRDSLGH